MTSPPSIRSIKPTVLLRVSVTDMSIIEAKAVVEGLNLQGREAYFSVDNDGSRYIEFEARSLKAIIGQDLEFEKK